MSLKSTLRTALASTAFAALSTAQANPAQEWESPDWAGGNQMARKFSECAVKVIKDDMLPTEKAGRIQVPLGPDSDIYTYVWGPLSDSNRQGQIIFHTDPHGLRGNFAVLVFDSPAPNAKPATTILYGGNNLAEKEQIDQMALGPENPRATKIKNQLEKCVFGQ